MHSAHFSKDTRDALERIRTARGHRSLAATLVALVAEADPGRPPPPPPPPHGAVLDAWAELCGPEPRTIRDVMATPGAAERLMAALRTAGLTRHGTASALDVGYAFRSIRGRLAAGRRLESVIDRNGVARWYVRGPEDGHQAAGVVGDGQAPGQAAAGAVAGP